MTQADPNRPIVISRIINAPRERVWKALIDPEDLVQWSHAGDGWVTPFAETDPVVGGTLKIGFASGDGKESFTLEGTYTEVSEPQKLVYSMGDDRIVSNTLEEVDGKTKITISFTPETENSEEKQREGWSQIADHLVQYLEK